MTKVVALQAWSNGSISMDEKSVLDIEDALASELIAAGICADASTYFGGGGTGGGVLVVTDTDGTLDKTAGEIFTAFNNGMVIIKSDVILPDVGTISARYLVIFASSLPNGPFTFECNVNGEATYYVADSADDYPLLDSGD